MEKFNIFGWEWKAVCTGCLGRAFEYLEAHYTPTCNLDNPISWHFELKRLMTSLPKWAQMKATLYFCSLAFLIQFMGFVRSLSSTEIGLTRTRVGQSLNCFAVNNDNAAKERSCLYVKLCSFSCSSGRWFCNNSFPAVTPQFHILHIGCQPMK